MASLERKTSKSGYDYEFVSPPPKTLECPVCLMTLRDPHVISCCGNEFCQVCIERVQRDGKPCPLCNEQTFSTMLHKKLVREVNALVVRCPQKELGCDWEGELGQLQSHLYPGAGVTTTTGCGFMIVECVHQCGVQLQRQAIWKHEMEVCPNRPIETQVASLMKQFEAVLIENQELKQELGKLHKGHQQGLEEVKGELDDLKRAHREQIEKLHEAKKTNELLQSTNKDLQRKYDVLKMEVDAIQKGKIDTATLNNRCKSLLAITMPLPVPPCYILMMNFDHFWKNDYVFKSDAFYSHPGGYKLFLIIQLNSHPAKRCTHISIFVNLLPGKFDDQLHWPFNGRIVVQAYNRLREKWSLERTIVLSERECGIDAVKRCVDAPNRKGGGCRDYIPFVHKETFLGETNTLRIRIAKIDIQQ